MLLAKMHSNGNDFIIAQALTQNVDDPSMLAKRLCRRRFSIGADTFALVCPSLKADFKMRIFNPDGFEAETCGNAMRCCAAYYKRLGFTQADRVTIETAGGIKTVLFYDNGRVSATIGKPKILFLNKKTNGFSANGVDMGNPHCTVFVKKFPNVEKYGRLLCYCSEFPNGANVEFVKPLSKNRFEMRTYERGVGETYSCGTGCCAALASGMRLGIFESKAVSCQRGGITIVSINNCGEACINAEVSFIADLSI